MTGRELYRKICEAGNLDGEVSRLTRDELAAVTEFLADLQPAGGVPSQVWGMVSARLVPQAERKQQRKARLA